MQNKIVELHKIESDCKKRAKASKIHHIQLSDTNGTSRGTGFYGQMKLKKGLFSSKPTRWDKKYPMPTVKYTAGSLMLLACFSAGGLVQMHGIMDSIKYQQIKNLNLTASVRNLMMGRVGSSIKNRHTVTTLHCSQKCIKITMFRP